MISTYKNKYDNVEFEYPIDSLIAELNSPNINIDSKKIYLFLSYTIHDLDKDKHRM